MTPMLSSVGLASVDLGIGRSAVQKWDRVEIEQEEDGRWIAEVVDLPLETSAAA